MFTLARQQLACIFGEKRVCVCVCVCVVRVDENCMQVSFRDGQADMHMHMVLPSPNARLL